MSFEFWKIYFVSLFPQNKLRQYVAIFCISSITLLNLKLASCNSSEAKKHHSLFTRWSTQQTFKDWSHDIRLAKPFSQANATPIYPDHKVLQILFENLKDKSLFLKSPELLNKALSKILMRYFKTSNLNNLTTKLWVTHIQTL